MSMSHVRWKRERLLVDVADREISVNQKEKERRQTFAACSSRSIASTSARNREFQLANQQKLERTDHVCFYGTF